MAADPSETTRASLEPDDSETSELVAAVRALSAQVGGLQTELNALRAQVRPLPELADAPGWGETTSVARESSPWIRTLERPAPRGRPVPRLLIEVVFIAGVALAAVVAELEPVVIVLLMAAAWLLVALVEWFAIRAEARHAAALAAPLAGAGAYFGEDPSWFGPSAPAVVATEPVDEDTQAGLPAPPAD